MEESKKKENYDDWRKYWNYVAPHVTNEIEKMRIPDAEAYLEGCFGIFSFVQQDIHSKVTKNVEYVSKLYSMVVQMQDMLRGTLVCQANFTLALAVFNRRTAFELYTNLLFITRNEHPAKMADYFERYAEVEKYDYDQQAPTPRLTDFDKKRIETNCPEWFFVRKGGQQGIIRKWTADRDLSLKEMATLLDQWDEDQKVEPKERLNMLRDYVMVYGTSSKFTHGSPLTWNLYKKEKGGNCIPHAEMPTQANVMTAHCIMEFLMEFCDHFGITFPEYEYALVAQYFLKLKSVLQF